MDDQFYPVIHPSNWPEATDYLHRPFLLDDSRNPILVAYTNDPNTLESYLTAEQLESSEKSREDIEQEAIQNWATHHNQLDWQTLAFSGGPSDTLAVRGGDYTTGSIILSNGHLKGIHKHFETEHLGIIIPSRGTIIAHPDFIALAKLGRRLFEEAKDRERELTPICFASYDAQVRGYVTPEYEKEHSEEDTLSEPEQIELAIAAINTALVMVGSKGEEDAEFLTPYAEKEYTVAEKACAKILEENLASTTEMAEKELSQLRLLTFLSQGVYNFDKASPDIERFALRKLVKELATKIAAKSGGGTFRMDSEAGQHEQSSLEIVLDVLR